MKKALLILALVFIVASSYGQDWFNLKAYAIGYQHDGIDIKIKLQSFGEKTLVIAKFTSDMKEVQYLVSKNPKYNKYHKKEGNYNNIEDYNYIFTGGMGDKYGILLEL